MTENNKTKTKEFTITLNEKQLRLLAYACRVTDRLIIGQLDFSLQECCEAAFEKLHKNNEAGKIAAPETEQENTHVIGFNINPETEEEEIEDE